MKNKIFANNSFLKNIENDYWFDSRAYHIENEVFWRRIALICVCLSVVIIFVSMYYINQDKHKVIVYEKNSLGDLTLLGLASKSLKVDNKVIAHQLANFIIALREAPMDIDLKKRNIEIVHKMIFPKMTNTVDQLIINQYKLALNGKINITINKIKPFESGNSWVVNWVEHHTLQDGTNLKPKNFSSIISFKINEDVDYKVQLINPIGIFITYVFPVEDFNDEK